MSTTVDHPVDSGSTAGKPAGLRPSRLQWLVLLTVLGADIMDLLDSTIVNVGAPSIARDLHASGSSCSG